MATDLLIPAFAPRGTAPRMALSPEQQLAAGVNLDAFAKHGVTGYAPNSLRSIRADWTNWMAFCVAGDRVAMPIAFDDVRAFVDAQVSLGRARATISHHLFTLRMMSGMYACPDPMAAPVAKAYWKDICRESIVAHQKQAVALTLADVERLLSGLDLTDKRDVRDAALVRMAYDLLARPSEVVAIVWEAIAFDESDGSGTYRFGRTKTDPDGAGVESYLSPETCAVLHQWHAFGVGERRYVFHGVPPRRIERGPQRGLARPLDVQAVGRIYARLAERAGFGKNAFSGHSARVGATVDMTRANFDLPAIMQAGRWKSPQMPARYAAKARAGRAGKDRMTRVRAMLSDAPTQ